MNILKPDYYDDFKCIADRCEEHCCKGWKVTIDKETFNKYRKIKGKIGTEINTFVNRDRKSTNESSYGKIKMGKREECPFLDDKRMCKIHAGLGEEFLSLTCRIYPRSSNKFNNIIEQGLTISCPEVARIILMNKNTITFKIVEEDMAFMKFNKNYIMDNEMYNLLWYTRASIISILQNRSVDLWKRITIIAMMCDKLQVKFKLNEYEECKNIVDEYLDKITQINFVKSLDEMLSLNELKVPIIDSIIRCINGGDDSSKINRIKKQLNEILNNDQTNNKKEVCDKYSQIEEIFFNGFLEKYEYILENYLVYYIYSNFIKDIEDKDVYATIVKMSINYAILKMLIIGVLAYNNEINNIEAVIEVFYSFSRSVEHNQSFVNALYSELKNKKYDELACLIILVK